MYCTVLYYSCSLDGPSDVMRLIYITVCITVRKMNRSHEPVCHNFPSICIVSTPPYRTVLCYAVLSTVLSTALLYCTVLYCTVLYYVI